MNRFCKARAELRKDAAVVVKEADNRTGPTGLCQIADQRCGAGIEAFTRSC